MVEVKYEDFVALRNLYNNFKYSTTSKIPTKSKLYIHKDVVMSRDSIRSSGYTIVRDISKADYVVADINKSLESGYFIIKRYKDEEFETARLWQYNGSVHLRDEDSRVDKLAPEPGSSRYKAKENIVDLIVLLSQDNLIEGTSLEIQRHTILDISTLTTIEAYLKSSDPEVIKMGVSLCTQCTSEDKYFLSYMKALLYNLPSKYINSVAAKQLMIDLNSKVANNNSTYYIESPESLEMYKKFVQDKLSEQYNVYRTESGNKIKVNYNVELEVE